MNLLELLVTFTIRAALIQIRKDIFVIASVTNS